MEPIDVYRLKLNECRSYAGLKELPDAPYTVEAVVQHAAELGVSTSDLLPDVTDPEKFDLDFQSMDQRELQKSHEQAVTRSTTHFLRAKGLRVFALRSGDPDKREPDAVARTRIVGQSTDFGIEVTCVGYYERGTREAANYAKDLWSSFASPDKTYSASLTNFDKVASFAQSLIEQKCEKSYALPTILVVDAVMPHVPLTPADDGVRIARNIKVPANCPFARIYVRMTWNFLTELEYFVIA